jgi:hypothetical protein
LLACILIFLPVKLPYLPVCRACPVCPICLAICSSNHLFAYLSAHPPACLTYLSCLSVITLRCYPASTPMSLPLSSDCSHHQHVRLTGLHRSIKAVTTDRFKVYLFPFSSSLSRALFALSLPFKPSPLTIDDVFPLCYRHLLPSLLSQSFSIIILVFPSHDRVTIVACFHCALSPHLSLLFWFLPSNHSRPNGPPPPPPHPRL